MRRSAGLLYRTIEKDACHAVVRSHQEASLPWVSQNNLCFATHHVGLADDHCMRPVPLQVIVVLSGKPGATMS